MMVTGVKGFERQSGRIGICRGAEQAVNLVPKVLPESVLADALAAWMEGIIAGIAKSDQDRRRQNLSA